MFSQIWEPERKEIIKSLYSLRQLTKLQLLFFLYKGSYKMYKDKKRLQLSSLPSLAHLPIIFFLPTLNKKLHVPIAPLYTSWKGGGSIFHIFITLYTLACPPNDRLFHSTKRPKKSITCKKTKKKKKG